MAYSPIAFTAPNYRDYKNEWIKAYEPGTTTPKDMATDSTLATFISKAQLNKDGFIVSAGGALIIPYIDGAYDLWLFPTEAEADANDTSNALRIADNITGALNQDGLDNALINDLSQTYDFETVALMTISTITFPVNKILRAIDIDAQYIVTAGSSPNVGSPDLVNTGYAALVVVGNFLKIKDFGADGTEINDTAAFYAAFAISGYIDLQGLTLNVTVTATTSVDKQVYIKNGAINFSAATALRVFTWVSGDLLRLEDVDITGNSNGTIDDSFDATSGTIALIRAELVVDGAAKNLQLERSSVKTMVAVEDNKNAVVSAAAFRVIGGYIRNCYFEDIPGHMFSSNSFVGIKITENEFKNIGALCVDFAALTSDCIFEYNEIDGAAGIGKTQNRFNSGELILPENNSVSYNKAVNLTSGNSSNVAVVKLSGKNDKCERNTVVYEGGTAVESIEVFGSAEVVDNTITRTLNKTRSYVTTVTDVNLAGVLDNPIVNIKGNKGSGMLNFARLQNTSVARVTIERNRPDDVAKFINGEANLNLPSLSILDNEYDCSATVGVGMQFSSSTVSLNRLKVHGNTCKSEGTGLVAWVAEGASVTGNTFEHVTGNNFDIISTNSYVVTGNGAKGAAWPATSVEKIVENNTIFA